MLKYENAAAAPAEMSQHLSTGKSSAAKLYPLSNYTFGTKDPLYEKDPSGKKRKKRDCAVK